MLLALLIAVTLLLIHVNANVTGDSSTVVNQTYDYIIVGGGLTGTVVASRLSENTSISVLLIEAGNDDRKNPLVYDPDSFTKAYETSLMYQWPTDKGKVIRGGRTLGGGSSINGMVWTRGLNAQYDSWSNLLEASEVSVGWNWTNLLRYMNKAETLVGPTESQLAAGASTIPSYHGSSGPIQAAFPPQMLSGQQQKSFIKSAMNLTGLRLFKDICGGTPNAASIVPFTIDPKRNNRRSSAPEGYLTPYEESRANLVTIVNHTVTSIDWLEGIMPLAAKGVIFAPSNANSTRYSVFARREVILAAGALSTPALLQLSGIGDPAALNRLGIPIKLNITTVGRNLQEQTSNVCGSKAASNASFPGKTANAIAYPNLYQLLGPKGNISANKLQSSLSALAESQANSALSADALRTIFQIQADTITQKNAPVVELLYAQGYPDTVGIQMWHLLPFSRGNVTITNKNPFSKPQINVNYFSAPWDLDIQVGGIKMCRDILHTKSLVDLTSLETYPGYNTVAKNASDEIWKSWITGNNPGFRAVHHPIGTSAMMRRNLGGVVDAHLKVYDTQNVRIVDAGIIPLQISAHLSSTLYGVAEFAADIIKGVVH